MTAPLEASPIGLPGLVGCSGLGLGGLGLSGLVPLAGPDLLVRPRLAMMLSGWCLVTPTFGDTGLVMSRT